MLRPRLEAALCGLFCVLTAITAIWPTWIESITGLEPDGGTGESEWGFVLVFAGLALALGLLARRHYRLATA